MAGHDLVAAAIREGKFPESRRAHYLALMAKNPKKTARLIARLEPGLLDHLKADDEEGRQAVRQFTGGVEAQAAPAAPGRGDASYPQDWLDLPGSGAAGSVATAGLGQLSGRGKITMEDETVRAQCIPGANVPEGLG